MHALISSIQDYIYHKLKYGDLFSFRGPFQRCHVFRLLNYETEPYLLKSFMRGAKYYNRNRFLT